MKNKHLGFNLDDFLEEEGLRADTGDTVIKWKGGEALRCYFI